jgi:hypothetical protein
MTMNDSVSLLICRLEVFYHTGNPCFQFRRVRLRPAREARYNPEHLRQFAKSDSAKHYDPEVPARSKLPGNTF